MFTTTNESLPHHVAGIHLSSRIHSTSATMSGAPLNYGAWTPVFAASLVNGDHIRTFHIRPAFPAGWQVSKDADQQVVREQFYMDWHRVERAANLYKREVDELRRQGWRDA